jgi:predicted TIM-barrel fold metal-dependent hydrolase
MLSRWLAQWPEKILYGSDASPTTDEVSWEETGWVASQTAREALARALDDLVRDHTITRARASDIARLVLRENAKKLYGL